MVFAIEPGRPVEAVEECRHSLPFIHVAESYKCGDQEYQERGSHALIGIIDNGIDILHQTFTDAAGHSRIVAIWDQRDKEGPAPDGVTGGRFYGADEIDRHVQAGTFPPKLGRNVAKDPQDDPTFQFGHGTTSPASPRGRQAGSFFGGIAPEAKLAVVIPKTDEPVGYSNSLVEALTFFERLATDLKLPVVVNVSLGTNGGAHDGTSPFEIAFDTFWAGGTKPGRIVMKSAGNEGTTDSHAEIFVGHDTDGEIEWERFEGGGFRSAPTRLRLWWPFAEQLRLPAAVARR